MQFTLYILPAILAITSAYPSALCQDLPKLTFKSRYQLSQSQILHETKSIISVDHRNQAQHILQNFVVENKVLETNGRGRGVLSKHNEGIITMYAEELDESVTMRFGFVLAGEGPRGCGEKERETGEGPTRLELRSAIVKKADVGRDAAVLQLIQDLAKNLELCYPNGINYIDDSFPHVVRSSSLVSSRDRVYTGELQISITDAEEEFESPTDGEEEEEGNKTELMTDSEELSMLLGLWKSTALVLKKDILGEGKTFEYLTLKGELYGIAFEFQWKFAEGCEDTVR